MGLLDIITGGAVSGLFGGAEKPKAIETPPEVKPVTEAKTTTETAAEAEAKRKAALLATNAGGGNTATTIGGGNADVTRKNLLGL